VDEELRSGDPARVGPYRIVRRLGEGGMGRVFLGQSASGRLFAVKVIHPDQGDNAEFRMRFKREIGAARKVSGAFTAGIVDADPLAELPWLAMEYVDGESLDRAVIRAGPLPLPPLRVMGAQLAEGLCAIHVAGIVHRDLKPTNILLAADGPRIIDFGVSKVRRGGALTNAGQFVGTPGYFAPEQALGDEARPASDVFSLGAVLAFAATGRPPFGTGTDARRIYRVVEGEPDLDGVPEEIRPLVERCLVKQPGDRPTAAAILAELGGGGYSASRLPVPAPAVLPVAAPDCQAVVTSLHPVIAEPVAEKPGAPVLNVTVQASGNARVIIAGGDVHVDR
jgi:serine/threonine protein kinase